MKQKISEEEILYGDIMPGGKPPTFLGIFLGMFVPMKLLKRRKIKTDPKEIWEEDMKRLHFYYSKAMDDLGKEIKANGKQ